MTKRRYLVTLPTPERCKELGIKHEGIETRTRMWLLGVASGVSLVSTTAKFEVTFTGRGHMIFHCNYWALMGRIREYLYGCTVEEIVKHKKESILLSPEQLAARKLPTTIN